MEPFEDFGADESPPPAIPAATLVIFRANPAGGPPQLLMVERSASMTFAGGAAVFPGGRVDPADRELAAVLAPYLGEEEIEEHAARIAAVRETLEETGLALGIDSPVTLEQAHAARASLLAQGAIGPVLEEFGWQLALDRLVPFARWCPRHRHLRIFDTRFYLYDIGTGAVDLMVDATENTHLFWATAQEALDLADSGKIMVIFPTRRNLERLAQFSSFADAVAHARDIPVRMLTPRIVDHEGARWLTIPDDLGYPVTREKLEDVSRG
ncbi:NUDIX domain-containing protein [Novosphingobium tardum]|uniref:NUDIX domain-containing protein n=1 Tax=Novosphingobium tardum TaxID=1538021 RepID=A0ABV8RUU6_9SPHN